MKLIHTQKWKMLGVMFYNSLYQIDNDKYMLKQTNELNDKPTIRYKTKTEAKKILSIWRKLGEDINWKWEEKKSKPSGKGNKNILPRKKGKNKGELKRWAKQN